MVQSYRHRPDVVEARLAAFERNDALFRPGNLEERAVALDAIQQAYQLLQLYRYDARWGRYQKDLRQQASMLEQRLRGVDAGFFQAVRDRILSGQLPPAALRSLFDGHTPYRAGRLGQVHRGYDALDALVQGLIRADEAPAVVQPQDGDMTHYEPTPCRAVLDMIDQSRLSSADVFFDIGAGIGHVALMVELLTGATSRAVEIEPIYCEHARHCASELSASNMEVINADARLVDYTQGTVFFMYTPFTGPIMQAVLDKLKQQVGHRPITICTFGASTFEVAQQSWVKLQHADSAHAYTIARFTTA